MPGTAARDPCWARVVGGVSAVEAVAGRQLRLRSLNKHRIQFSPPPWWRSGYDPPGEARDGVLTVERNFLFIFWWSPATISVDFLDWDPKAGCARAAGRGERRPAPTESKPPARSPDKRSALPPINNNSNTTRTSPVFRYRVAFSSTKFVGLPGRPPLLRTAIVELSGRALALALALGPARFGPRALLQ